MKIFKFIILLTIIIFTLVSRSLLYNDSDIFNSVIKILSSIFAIIMSYYAVVVLKINVTLPKKESTKHSFYPYFLLLVVLLNIYFITWPRTISDFNFLNVSFLVLAVFLAAAAEEFIFRYLSYNFLFNLTNKTQKSVLFSSILFALIHLINLKHAVNITSIINQVVFAFFLGVLLSSLFLYSNKILLPIVVHSLINLPSFLQNVSPEVSPNAISTFNIFSVLVTQLFFLPAYIAAIVFYRIALTKESVSI